MVHLIDATGQRIRIDRRGLKMHPHPLITHGFAELLHELRKDQWLPPSNTDARLLKPGHRSLTYLSAQLRGTTRAHRIGFLLRAHAKVHRRSCRSFIAIRSVTVMTSKRTSRGPQERHRSADETALTLNRVEDLNQRSACFFRLALILSLLRLKIR